MGTSATARKQFAIFLRFNAKAYEPIVALRDRYPPTQPEKLRKSDPINIKATSPTFPIIRRLPRMELAALEARVSNFASMRKPFDLKLGLPQVLGPPRSLQEGQAPLYGVGFQYDKQTLDQLRIDIFEDFNRHIEEFGTQGNEPFRIVPLKPESTGSLWICTSSQGYDTEEKAAGIVEELRKEYPNGFGPIPAEGLTIREAQNSPARTRTYIITDLATHDFGSE
ncbi:uncharacterized protein RSE6_00445 [Rhynchosporium secalis]|uniref:Uncharacterized protein n=1 Tax=Rhynchosporium secalis TaxID=38038 RepID=A0A1E1LVC8_RHYSE|nr:uncharacterized protein RSE6_00445 [Rhynchosporium secalis]